MSNVERRRIDAPGSQIEPILRITSYLRTETDALRRFAPCDLERGIHIKSQALLELTRHARTLVGALPDPALGEALKQLRTGLAENQAAVTLHLDAARRVSAIVVSAMERENSDRTYSNSPARSAYSS